MEHLSSPFLDTTRDKINNCGNFGTAIPKNSEWSHPSCPALLFMEFIMSIICPACQRSLKQITNTHVKSKHSEYTTMKEFRDHFNIEKTWASEISENFSKDKTGTKRGKYILTEAYHAGRIRAARKISGENHFNYGKNLNDVTKQKISKSVKESELVKLAQQLWKDPTIKMLRSKHMKESWQQRKIEIDYTKLIYIKDYDKYKKEIAKETRKTMRMYKAIINPLNLSSGYHIDHMFSKYMGFILKIPSFIIGSVANLHIISGKINRQKSSKCSITIKHLLERYESILDAVDASDAFKSWKTQTENFIVFDGLGDAVCQYFYDLPDHLVSTIPKIDSLLVS